MSPVVRKCAVAQTYGASEKIDGEPEEEVSGGTVHVGETM